MKKITRLKLTLAVLIGLVSTSVLAEPATYEVDPMHTSVVVSWNHFGFSNPMATFADVTGEIVFDKDDPQASKVSVTIPVKTVDTRVAKLTEEFMGKDYFDQAQYPNATFVSTSVEPKGGDDYDVTGNLTIKGHTKSVVLHAHLNQMGQHPMANKPAIGFNASTVINRSDFGMDMYVPNVSDQIGIRISTEAVEK